jgi:hypothetical protein
MRLGSVKMTNRRLAIGSHLQIAVGGQDCILRLKDSVLSQKYVNRRGGFFKSTFHRIRESSDFSRWAKPQESLLDPQNGI